MSKFYDKLYKEWNILRFMVQENIHGALKKYGLSDNEIRVYIACLQLGSSSVTRIAEKAGTYRTLTYEVLKSLLEQGLVSYVIKEKKKFFEAAQPKQFLSFLEEKEELIEQVLPDLEGLYKIAPKKPAITLYEGKEGMKTIFEDILNARKDFVALSNVNNLKKLFSFYFPHFVERRVKAGIHCKLILDGPPLTRELLDFKVIKKEFSAVFFIYGNKVAFLSLTEKEPIGTIIENKEIADSQRLAFEIMWQGIR